MACSTPTPLHLVPALASPGGWGVPADLTSESDADHVGSVISSGQSVAVVGDPRDLLSQIGRGRLHLLTEQGMATAEYAVGLIAACAFAGVLYKLVTSSAIYGLLNKLAEVALRVIG